MPNCRMQKEWYIVHVVYSHVEPIKGTLYILSVLSIYLYLVSSYFFSSARKLVRIYCYSWWYGNLTYNRCPGNNSRTLTFCGILCVCNFWRSLVWHVICARCVYLIAGERIFAVVSIDNVQLFSCLHIVFGVCTVAVCAVDWDVVRGCL